MMKTSIIESLGEHALTLPAQLEVGLAANDRLKYYFTLLQVPRSHADQPNEQASSLKRERTAAEVRNSALDRVVATAHKEGTSYQLAESCNLMLAIAEDASLMAVPADASAKQRLKAIVDRLPKAENDLLAGSDIDMITSAGREGATACTSGSWMCISN